ncbi:MAG: hypothetical protein HC802_18215 [Caldilineaceae bacterium]|nr:hypothetical protein [Caldilineaceae bacterium]
MALLGMSLFSLTGLAANLWPAARRFALTPLLLMTLAVAGVAAVMARYSLIALGTDQGRLLYPAVAPLILLWVVGLAWWTPGRAGRWAGAMLVAGMGGLALFALLGVVRPAF